MLYTKTRNKIDEKLNKIFNVEEYDSENGFHISRHSKMWKKPAYVVFLLRDGKGTDITPYREKLLEKMYNTKVKGLVLACDENEEIKDRLVLFADQVKEFLKD